MRYSTNGEREERRRPTPELALGVPALLAHHRLAVLGATIEGRIEHHDARADARDPARLAQRRGEVLGVVQRGVEHDDVELAAGQRDAPRTTRRRAPCADPGGEAPSPSTRSPRTSSATASCAGDGGAVREPAVPRAEVEHAQRAGGADVGAPPRRPQHAPLERLPAARPHRPLPRQRTARHVGQRARVERGVAFGGAMLGVSLTEKPTNLGGNRASACSRELQCSTRVGSGEWGVTANPIGRQQYPEVVNSPPPTPHHAVHRRYRGASVAVRSNQ